MQATESATGTPYEHLVQRERVHGSLYTEEQIFAEELARIWYTTWVFVGHLSEVPQPNDYVRKNIGPQEVIMTRDRDGDIHLLMNRCAHRGSIICAEPHGNSSAFRFGVDIEGPPLATTNTPNQLLTVSGTSATFTWPSTQQANGVHTLWVSCTDANGNFGIANEMVTVAN